ncbi:MAG: hypothetical protein JW894_07160 [Bacteroidales bacterium]|nr:hypothetical protein [Bacteroidales bacterium]
MIRLLFVSVFIYVNCNCFSQEFSVKDFRRELNIKIEVIDEKRIEKGVEILNEAFSIERESLAVLETIDDTIKMEGTDPVYRRAIKNLIDASEEYKEGSLMIYTVFDENCGKFELEMRKMNHYASGLNKAKYYERKAEQTIRRSNRIREFLLEADKPEWIQYKMHEALELEKKAIRNKGRALQIYQDFPVEYNYGWDDDVSDEELARFFNDPSVKLPPDDIFKKKPKPVNVKDTVKVEYRVQIAAHTVILTDEYIRTFYTGEDTVMQIKEGQWYKYQIGSFDNFKDANQLRIRCRVPRAFVVAYINDNKVTIKKALAFQQAQ